MVASGKNRVRRGVTLVESAVILLVFLGLVLGMLDLGIGVLRYHSVSEAARHGARQAIVHGKLAPPALQAWGPITIDALASDQGIPIVDAIRPRLVGFDLDRTRIRAEWSDGTNEPEKRIRVTITTFYQPIMTFIFGNPTYTIRATSTMPIAH